MTVSRAMLLLLFASAPAGADEQALWELWQRHTEAPEDHAVQVRACRTFSAANVGSPFVPVVQGIESWHLLKLHRTNDAVRILQAHVAADQGPIERGAGLLARAWLTRLQREQIRRALQLYYVKEVRYPASLEALWTDPAVPEALQPPTTDLWGTPWQYRLVGFRGVPGFLDQKYELFSMRLRETSDLEAALQVPYGDHFRFEPSRTLSGARGPRTIKLEPVNQAPGGTVVVLTEGRETDGFYLAHLGEALLVACDRLHWKIFLRPRDPSQRG